MKSFGAWIAVGFLSIALPVAAQTALTAEDFVTQAASNGRHEIQLAQLALQRAQSPALRGIANLLVKDLGASNDALERLAADKSLEFSTTAEERRAFLATWRDLPEAQFDAEYLEHLLSSHEEAIELYRSAAQGSDERLAKFARANLADLQLHLQLARDLQGQIPSARVILASE